MTILDILHATLGNSGAMLPQFARPYTYPVSRKPYGIAKSRRAARKRANAAAR